MDRRTLFGLDRARLVDRIAENIHDAAERSFADRNLDRSAGVADHHSTAQAIGRSERDGTHDAIAELLLDLERQRAAFHLESVVYPRDMFARKFNVDHCAYTLNDLAFNHLGSLCRRPSPVLGSS